MAWQGFVALGRRTVSELTGGTVYDIEAVV